MTITGLPGTGTSSAAHAVANELGFAYFSSGSLFRAIAKRRGVSVEELNRIAESSKEIDDEVDDALRALGEQEGLVIDSRIAYHWIPDSFKVCLAADPMIAAERIYAHIVTSGRESQHAESVQEVFDLGNQRRESEQRRYLDRYGIDVADDSPFDLRIDSGNKGLDAVVEEILVGYRDWMAGR